LLHHQSEKIVSFLKAEKNGILKDCKVQYLIEPIPMDTGGAVAYAVQQLHLSDNFLVTNADTWNGSSFQDLVRSEAPSMGVLKFHDTSRYGRVKFDGQFYVTDFEEKSYKKGPDWINAGLYHLHCDLFKGWNGQPFSLERSFLPKLANYGALTAVTLQTNFIDIGIPSDYFRFCQWIASDRKGIL
jgi:NDP-sugar pyrophosphorylase family protein